MRDIQKDLTNYAVQAEVFNKREALFGGGAATEYDQLQKITKDFEPYASLWTVASDWQKW